MTALTVLAFISFLWIAHGFWRDYVASKRPLTPEQRELIKQQILNLELELFHKRLHLQELASPWEPTTKLISKPTPHTYYQLGNGNIIDLELHPSPTAMFISAADKLIYLQSTEWRIIRTERLRIAQQRCEYCGSTESLQCHHITYERLTAEHIDDIVILCGGSNGCHQKIHNILGYDRTTEYPISLLKEPI